MKGALRSWPQGLARSWWLLGSGAAVSGVALAVVLGSTLAGWPVGGPDQAAAGTTRRADDAGSDQRRLFVHYRDPQGRFTVSHPKGWARMPSSDPQVALLLRERAESQNSMLVRVVPLPESVDPTHLDAVNKLTDRLVDGSDLQVVVEQQITMDGRPGFYHLYTFSSGKGSNSFGVHAHYFVFSGSTMYVLVFQALPDTDFVELAPTFDRIARSFQLSE